MPYLQSAHTDDETRDHFARVVGDRPQAWWVVRHQEQIVAYMLIYGEDLDHLYVSPRWQGQGFGSALLDAGQKASKPRSPSPLDVPAQRARACLLRSARLPEASNRPPAGENEEREQDVQYEWRRAP